MVDLSKDELVDNSISKMQTLLDELLETEFIDSKNPIKDSFSVTLNAKNAPTLLFSNGKGSSQKACKASALGEFIERLQTNNFFSDFYIKDFIYDKTAKTFKIDEYELDAKLKVIYDENGELQINDLIDFISEGNNIVTTEFTELHSDKKINCPINILHNLYVSNGLSAGNSKYEARVQALSEIIERYVKKEIISRGFAIPKIPENILRNLQIYNGLEVLRKQGYLVDVYDASLGGKYPVIAISLINEGSLFVSFGAHPIFEVAVERTFTELLQGRELNELNNFQIPTFNKDEVQSSFNIENHFIDSNGKILFDFLKEKKDFEYSPWNFSGGNRKKEFESLVEIFKDKDIYVKDFDYLGFYSCQIIIPTISEIYPIDDLIYNNKNRGKFYRELILNYKNYAEEELLDSFEELEDTLEIDKFIGVRFRNKYFVSDLKAQIYIKLGDLESAKFYLSFNDSKLNNILIELIEMKQRGENIEKYELALHMIFGNECKKALNILQNREDYLNFEYNDEYKEILRIASLIK